MTPAKLSVSGVLSFNLLSPPGVGVGGDYLALETICFYSWSFWFLHGETADVSIDQSATPALGHLPFEFPQRPVPVCLSAVKAVFPMIEVAEKGDGDKYLPVASSSRAAGQVLYSFCLHSCVLRLPPAPPNLAASFTTGNKGSETLCQLLMVF